jgi:hypothetical protein
MERSAPWIERGASVRIGVRGFGAHERQVLDERGAEREKEREAASGSEKHEKPLSERLLSGLTMKRRGRPGLYDAAKRGPRGRKWWVVETVRKRRERRVFGKR